MLQRLTGNQPSQLHSTIVPTTSRILSPTLGQLRDRQTSSMIRNSQLYPRASLSSMRYTDAGQKYDLERVFMGGPMSVVAKREHLALRRNHAEEDTEQAKQKVEAMRGAQFYVALDAARVAQKIGDFAKHIRSNEPILRMDRDLRSWNVASSHDPSVLPQCHRLQIYESDPTLSLLGHYLHHAQSRPATSVIKAGIRYVELGLPYVRSYHRL